MIMKCFIAALLFCLLSAGLAAASPPSYDQLAKLPVIRFGEPVPESDYILMFPAGQPITISVSVEGSLFTNAACADWRSRRYGSSLYFGTGQAWTG
jgi:hypothetical protein